MIPNGGSHRSELINLKYFAIETNTVLAKDHRSITLQDNQQSDKSDDWRKQQKENRPKTYIEHALQPARCYTVAIFGRKEALVQSKIMHPYAATRTLVK